MFLLVNRRLFFFLLGAILGGWLMATFVSYQCVQTIKNYPISEQKYRIFVKGIGTVEGVWAGNIGIAITGVRDSANSSLPDRIIKEIDVLVTNASDQEVYFNPDFNLVSEEGDSLLLPADGQPEVKILPRAMSKGTLMIDVPRKKEKLEWQLEVSGGCFDKKVIMPLKVLKVTE